MAIPGVPTNLNVQTRDGALYATWSASTNTPTNYQIYYATDASGPWTLFETNPATDRNSLISPLTNGTDYWVQVTASNADGVSDPATAGPFVPNPRPATPRNVRALPFRTGLLVRWDSDPVATRYAVRWRLTGTTTYSPIQYVDAPTTEYFITGITPDSDYDIFVSANNTTGTSAGNTIGPIAASVYAAPTPSGVTASSSSGSSVDLSWVAAPDAIGYDIVVSTTAPAGWLSDTTASPAVPPGSTPTVVPPAPRGISPSPLPGALDVSWRPVNTADDYRGVLIQGGVTTYGPWSTDTHYTFTGLTDGVVYSVGAQARNSFGISSASTDSNVSPRSSGVFDYTERVWHAPGAGTLTHTVSGLSAGVTYYFLVRPFSPYGFAFPVVVSGAPGGVAFVGQFWPRNRWNAPLSGKTVGQVWPRGNW